MSIFHRGIWTSGFIFRGVIFNMTPALALGEVQYCDVRGGHNRWQSDFPKTKHMATKTSLCFGMMYFQRCGIYIWSACKKTLSVYF